MEIRATGMAIGFAAKTALVVMLVQVTPIAIEAISWRYFVIFIVMDIIFVVGFWLYFPEVSNRSLLTTGTDISRPPISRSRKLPPCLEMRLWSSWMTRSRLSSMCRLSKLGSCRRETENMRTVEIFNTSRCMVDACIASPVL